MKYLYPFIFAALTTSFPLRASDFQSRVQSVINSDLNTNRVTRIGWLGELPQSRVFEEYFNGSLFQAQAIYDLQAEPQYPLLSTPVKDVLIFLREVNLAMGSYLLGIQHTIDPNNPKAADLNTAFELQIEARQKIIEAFMRHVDQADLDWSTEISLYSILIDVQNVRQDLTANHYAKLKQSLSQWPEAFEAFFLRASPQLQKNLLTDVLASSFQSHKNIFYLEAQQILLKAWREGKIRADVKESVREKLLKDVDNVSYANRLRLPIGIDPWSMFATQEKELYTKTVSDWFGQVIPDYLRTDVKSAGALVEWVKKLSTATPRPTTGGSRKGTTLDKALWDKAVSIEYAMTKDYHNVLAVIYTFFAGRGAPGRRPVIPGSDQQKDLMAYFDLLKNQGSEDGENEDELDNNQPRFEIPDFARPGPILEKLVYLYQSHDITPLFTEYNLKLIRDFIDFLEDADRLDSRSSSAVTRLFNGAVADHISHPRIFEIALMVVVNPEFTVLARWSAVNYLLAHGDGNERFPNIKESLLAETPKIEIIPQSFPGAPPTVWLGDVAFYDHWPVELREIWTLQEGCEGLLNPDNPKK